MYKIEFFANVILRGVDFLFKCPRCGNTQKEYIGFKNNEPYCRKCIKFSNNKNLNIPYVKNKDVVINMKYDLSISQDQISNELLNNIEKENNILVYAVCGAGKTEIIVKVIERTLKKGGQVGIIIPRRDLVVELGKRIQDIFVNNKVTLVYGGHHDDLTGDIIVLTSHQAFRYNKYFDLVILDEIDAFPYVNNDVLKSFVLNSSKGKIISLSATPSELDLKNNKVFTLFKRYHNNPLPVPKLFISFDLLLLLFISKKVKSYLKDNKYVFIYVPSIKEGKNLYKKIKKLFSCVFVFSSMENKEEVMKDVRAKKYNVIITTTILERGVTFNNLQVLVYKSNEFIFNKETLIQIAGRVGRTFDCPDGDVYFLANSITKEMKEAIKEIKKYNDM